MKNFPRNLFAAAGRKDCVRSLPGFAVPVRQNPEGRK